MAVGDIIRYINADVTISYVKHAKTMPTFHSFPDKSVQKSQQQQQQQHVEQE